MRHEGTPPPRRTVTVSLGKTWLKLVHSNLEDCSQYTRRNRELEELVRTSKKSKGEEQLRVKSEKVRRSG